MYWGETGRKQKFQVIIVQGELIFRGERPHVERSGGATTGGEFDTDMQKKRKISSQREPHADPYLCAQFSQAKSQDNVIFLWQVKVSSGCKIACGVTPTNLINL